MSEQSDSETYEKAIEAMMRIISSKNAVIRELVGKQKSNQRCDHSGVRVQKIWLKSSDRKMIDFVCHNCGENFTFEGELK